jgi:hypothetical protein
MGFIIYRRTVYGLGLYILFTLVSSSARVLPFFDNSFAMLWYPCWMGERIQFSSLVVVVVQFS